VAVIRGLRSVLVLPIKTATAVTWPSSPS